MDSLKRNLIVFARWSERYTKTDMVYLLGQSGWLLIGQGVIFVASMLMAWVFANYMDPADYGLYKYVLAIVALANITTLTGMGIALAQAVSKGLPINVLKTIKVRILFGTLGTLGIAGVATYYYVIGNELLALLFVVGAIFVPFYDTLSDYQYYLQGKKDFKTQTTLRILQRVILSLVVISALISTDNLILIVCTFFAATTLSQAISLFITIKKYPLTEDHSTQYSEVYNYGKRISFQNIFYLSAAQLDKVLLFKFLGPTQLAIYYFAIAIPQELSGVLGNVNSVAFPKLVEKHSREFKIALLKKIFLFSILLVIPVTSYIVLAPFLFTWFFPAYTDAVFISQLFVGAVFFVPTALLWQYFYAVDHKRALLMGSIVGPTVFLGAIAILTPLFGLVGAVLATYVRGIVDLTMGLYYFIKKV